MPAWNEIERLNTVIKRTLGLRDEVRYQITTLRDLETALETLAAEIQQIREEGENDTPQDANPGAANEVVDASVST